MGRETWVVLCMGEAGSSRTGDEVGLGPGFAPEAWGGAVEGRAFGREGWFEAASCLVIVYRRWSWKVTRCVGRKQEHPSVLLRRVK